MRKLKQFVECALNGKNQVLTLLEIRDIERIYVELFYNHKAETIIQKSSEICKIAGLNVNSHGIGWLISK